MNTPKTTFLAHGLFMLLPWNVAYATEEAKHTDVPCPQGKLAWQSPDKTLTCEAETPPAPAGGIKSIETDNGKAVVTCEKGKWEIVLSWCSSSADIENNSSDLRDNRHMAQ